MQACIGELLGNASARRVLLHLVSPVACRRLQSPAQVAVLEPRIRLRPPGADRALHSKQAAAAGAADASTAQTDPAVLLPADNAAASATEQVTACALNCALNFASTHLVQASPGSWHVLMTRSCRNHRPCSRAFHLSKFATSDFPVAHEAAFVKNLL